MERPKRKLDIIKLLLENGADPFFRCSTGHAVVHAATRGEGSRNHEFRPETLELLLSQGFDMNTIGAHGETSLWYIINTKFGPTANAPEIAKWLIARGASVNTQAENGMTVLFRAAHIGDIATIHVLVDHGADVNIKTTKGTSPMIAAARSLGSHSHKRRVECIQLLLGNGADINPSGSGGKTLLHEIVSTTSSQLPQKKINACQLLLG